MTQIESVYLDIILAIRGGKPESGRFATREPT